LIPKTILSESIITLKGIGDKSLEAFAKYNIRSIKDIIFFLPYRYEILSEGSILDKGILTGTYEVSDYIYARSGKKILKILFKREFDYVAALYLNFYNNYPLSLFKKGNSYNLYGTISRNGNILSIFHPELIPDNELNSIRPIYHSPSSMSQLIIRKAIKEAITIGIKDIDETLPDYILDKYQFPSLKDSLTTIHNPMNIDNVKLIQSREHPVYQRFIYEELFYLNLLLAIKRNSYQENKGIAFRIDKSFLEDLKDLIPFKLTDAQRKVLVEIFNDMRLPKQMNRLVQGDVGSGKTIVAFISAAISIMNGYQSVLIAPTEVLAEQHFENLNKLFKGNIIKSAIITGSVSKKNKDAIKKDVEAHKLDFIIGTHALLEDDLIFNKLGLIIVDEQHRFGVEQRKKLIRKGTPTPDIILMSATPIPRTLAMTLYGDLDLSIIDQLPPGRIKPITKSYRADKLESVLDTIKPLLDSGEKAFFIYPLIDESDKSDLKAATQSYKYLCKYYSDKRIGLIHGKLKSDEKRDMLKKFSNGDLDILISTTVVEVGVDIPLATIMLIENADRFGLSQLHQLRGRIGRSDRQSYCYLVFSQDITDTGRERIKAMVNYTDGFKLAEIDLQLRGQGDLFGTKQSGDFELRFADILMDIKVIEDSKRDALEYISSGVKDKVVEDRITILLGDSNSYIGVG